MSIVNFTNLDFDQIKASIKDYLRANSNFTDYDFEGSNITTIIDILAYNTYITSYNANMVANEVFIDSATLRENVVSLAKNIGYLPRSRKAATATVSFFVDTSNLVENPVSLTLHKGPVVASTNSFSNQSYIFSIPDDITVPVTNNVATFNNIKVYEGSLLNTNFIYNQSDINQKFILPNTGIDTELIRVFVKDSSTSSYSRKYSHQDSLFSIDEQSKVYFLQEISGERYELFFGDGIFGKKLNNNNYIEVYYITCNGESANGVSQFVFSGRITFSSNSNEIPVTAGVSLITTDIPSLGGESIESTESVRKFAPRIYATQNRALTANDYESLIPSKIYPETESISVFGGEEVIPPQYGKVFISIKPRTGDYLPNLTKENIKLKLKKYAVAGIVPEILDLKYLYVESTSKVYYNTNLTPSPDYILSIVQKNIETYANSTELNKYGARFKYSKLLKIIDDSHEAITSNITTIEMRRDLRIIQNKLTEYQIGFGNRFYIQDSQGFNIKSTQFSISDFEEPVYISDLPNTDGQTGSLFFFTLPSPTSFQPTIVRRNIGNVNYTSGIITINPIVITKGKLVDGQEVIELSTKPYSNDIIGLQDLYLQLDTTKLNFEAVVDEISSGLDPSASNYIVSSSYNSGNLVRI